MSIYCCVTMGSDPYLSIVEFQAGPGWRIISLLRHVWSQAIGLMEVAGLSTGPQVKLPAGATTVCIQTLADYV